MSLKWLLFDLDNTLLDFDAGARKSLEETLVEFGYGGKPDLIESYHQINQQCWQKFERGDIDIPTLKRLRFEFFVRENKFDLNPADLNRAYLDRLSQQTVEISGARQLLENTRNTFRLALVTNGFAEVQRPRIRRSGLHRYFEHIVISEEIGSNKPATAFFDHTFTLMGRPDPEEVMIIGDSLSSDIKGGLDYGIRTCWFNRDARPNDSSVIPHHTVHSLEHIPGLWK
jgi:2-haloacid dehalogenase